MPDDLGITGLPADLPSVINARLPVSYESAKAAISHCVEIDECQEWADKAEAMASYARQAQDQELRKMADRIQGRAVRRCGELLEQIKARQGARTDLRPGAGRRPQVDVDAFFADPISILEPLTRKEAAKQAGLSVRQRKTALRVARVPQDEFEDAIKEKIEADEIIRKEWICQEVLLRHPVPEFPGSDFTHCCRHMAVSGQINKVNRLFKETPESVSQGELPLAGYTYLQRAYPLERDGETVLVPITRMTPDERQAKVAIYRQMAHGCNGHADELERYDAQLEAAD